MNKHLFAIIGVMLAAGAGLTAQSGSISLVKQRPNLRFAEPWRPNTMKGDTRIIGTVIDIRQMPVAGAKVQLRNLVTGEVTGGTESNDMGEYSFTVSDPGTFVVEMVMVGGQVVALSNAGSLGRYETLQTVVQLPGRWDNVASTMTMPQNVGSFVGMSAETTMTAATLTIAAETAVTPVDSGEPVSP